MRPAAFNSYFKIFLYFKNHYLILYQFEIRQYTIITKSCDYSSRRVRVNVLLNAQSGFDGKLVFFCKGFLLISVIAISIGL